MTPGLRGRVDLARYAVSLGRARNFITKPTGGGAKRPGTIMRGRAKFSDRATRLVPFIYSTQVKYLIEMGDLYFRFWVNGSLLTSAQKPITGITKANPAVVSSAAHGYASGDFVVISGVRGMTKLNARTYQIANVTGGTYELVGINTTGADYAAYTSGGSGDRIVEVVTPYAGADIYDVRFTQSADVLYLAHGRTATKELRRLTATSFELRDFAYRRGPFRPINVDEAAVMAVDKVSGIITVSSNIDVFNVGMVGALIYLEEKELRGVKPWASAEKNVPTGALRRSDSKVYKMVGKAGGMGSVGTPYFVSGNVRPTHDSGRAFDGPGDVKFDGVNDYGVGVEWEFLHNTFGILKITGFTDSKHVTAEVIERVPDSIVGTVPTPVAGPWTLSGDNVTKTFAIAGATSESNSNYTVVINGTPTQSNPNYPGGGVNGGGGGTVRPGGINSPSQDPQ